MALIKCPECGKEISDKAPACIHCGFPMEEKVKNNSIDIVVDEMTDIKIDENVSEQIIVDETGTAYTIDTDKQNDAKADGTSNESSSKWMIGIMVVFLALVILVVVIQTINENKEQQALANQAIAHFQAGEYEQASDVKWDLNKDNLLGEYEEKISLMGQLQRYYNLDDCEYKCVLYYIGNYDKFEKLGMIDIAYPMVKDAAQQVANQELNIATQFERSMNDDEMSKYLEPMLSTNKEKMLEVMEQIDGDIDYDLAMKEYEKYLKEKAEQSQREYDREHPVQVTNDDCTITRKNGYYYCNGTVHNVSGSTHYYVKVKVTYSDANNEVLTTDWTYAVGSEGIKGGENQQFEIMTKVSGSPEYYRVEIIGWD